MHPFMAATGPSFRQGYHLSSLHSVDIYPLMCHLLQIPPQPNNGTLTMARCLLANEVCGESLVVVSFVMGVIFFLLTIVGKFTWLQPCYNVLSVHNISICSCLDFPVWCKPKLQVGSVTWSNESKWKTFWTFWPNTRSESRRHKP